ncbi:MAG: D-alanyl-D-alanine carboxypeptidase/D-alanyl-D-alanine-endopeptidase [Candidatus Sericytochromatia bacterium]|nr:D-alanyl-D-alanine carboxypeptidase/D-alanyl-D-alanine-endopeptidase [Candidatus Sericytochromatia bacterium]
MPLPRAAAAPAGALDKLQSQMAGLVNTPALSAQNTGVAVISLQSGELLYGGNAQRALMPASNLKLLTSAAAMTLLGPDFAFRTALYGDGTVTGGILSGSLYLKGFGDPDLNQKRIDEIAEALLIRGVRQISDLVADDSFFDERRFGLGWMSRYAGLSYSAPIGALSITQNVAKVWLKAGEPGKPAQLRLEPDSDYYKVVNGVRTVPGYANSVGVRFGKLVDGRRELVVSGVFGTRTPTDAASFNIDEPALVVGGTLLKSLRKAGVIVTGRMTANKTPATATPLVINASRPLVAILTDFNKHSINFIGEQLLKYLGATFRGEPGTGAKGADVIREDFVHRLVGTDPAGMVIADGSGLSTLNRISAVQFASVLRYMYSQAEYRPDFLAALPIAGVDGTLANRFKATPAQGVLRAKTGFINGVCTLSGYTTTKDDEPVAFSFLMNDYKDLWAARVVQERLGILLTLFHR